MKTPKGQTAFKIENMKEEGIMYECGSNRIIAKPVPENIGFFGGQEKQPAEIPSANYLLILGISALLALILVLNLLARKRKKLLKKRTKSKKAGRNS